MNAQNFSHEGWCDSLGCATDSCNCMMAYPIYLLQKMQKALEYYADKANWKHQQVGHEMYGVSQFVGDGGDVARKALGTDDR